MYVARIPMCDLHTHSSFCDGEDSLQDFADAAMEKGMKVLGFSAHAPVSFDLEHSMRREDIPCYREEVFRLRESYRGRLAILLGVEQDFYAEERAEDYDYVIGAVHSLCLDGCYFAIDESKESLKKFVKTYFGGDFYRFSKHYFSLIAELPERTGCDIIGHFDLLTKFNGKGDLFDETDPRYLRPALDALDALLEKDVALEINTSDMCAGLRKIPYPAPLFLHRIAEMRGRVILSSDAHRKEDLLCGFPKALQIARASGMGAVSVLTPSGWEFFPVS